MSSLILKSKPESSDIMTVFALSFNFEVVRMKILMAYFKRRIRFKKPTAIILVRTRTRK